MKNYNIFKNKLKSYDLGSLKEELYEIQYEEFERTHSHLSSKEIINMFFERLENDLNYYGKHTNNIMIQNKEENIAKFYNENFQLIEEINPLFINGDFSEDVLSAIEKYGIDLNEKYNYAQTINSFKLSMGINKKFKDSLENPETRNFLKGLFKKNN